MAVLTGNRCGHDRLNPKGFRKPRHHRRRPNAIKWMQERLQDYYAQPWRIPTMMGGAYGKSSRQKRSERREAIILVLSTLLQYTDLLTLRIGTWREDGKWGGIGEQMIADITGLSLRRVQSAMRELRMAGIIACHPIAERQEDGTYRGLWAIRAINAGLWEAFGLSTVLAEARARANAPEVQEKIKRAKALVPGRERGRDKLKQTAMAAGPLGELRAFLSA